MIEAERKTLALIAKLIVRRENLLRLRSGGGDLSSGIEVGARPGLALNTVVHSGGRVGLAGLGLGGRLGEIYFVAELFSFFT